MALFSILTPTLIGDLTFQKFRDQARDVVFATWYLGVTAFGGPAVHFQIVWDHLRIMSVCLIEKQ